MPPDNKRRRQDWTLTEKVWLLDFLITDNAPTHIVSSAEPVVEHGHKVFNLSHMKVVFLPPNVTSHVQPLDQGIIASMKAHYRRQLVEWMLDEANKPGNASKTLKDLTANFYQMLLWLKQAWSIHVTAKTIENCWRKSGLLPAPEGAQPEPVNEDAGVAQLRSAIGDLQSAARSNGMIPAREELVIRTVLIPRW